MDIPSHIHSSGSGSHSSLTKVLIFLAFAIPIAVLFYALYINFLPFGYENSYSLSVDEQGVISPISKEIYLTNSQGRKILSLPEGVNGQVNLVIEPKVVLKKATVEVNIEGEGVYLGAPLSVNLSEVQWTNSWDFTGGVPADLVGSAEYNEQEGCVYFDAVKEQTLSLPNSQDMFESGPMSIYVKWKPSQTSAVLGDGQQIVGHYNWEIWQNANQVRFNVGRMNNATGPSYSISHQVSPDFFGKEHEVVAVYSPSIEGNGYIQMWVDGNFAGRINLGNDIIYRDYNSNKPMSLGWTPHNYEKNPYFDGCVYWVSINDKVISDSKISAEINANGQQVIIPIVGKGNLSSATVEIVK